MPAAFDVGSHSPYADDDSDEHHNNGIIDAAHVEGEEDDRILLSSYDDSSSSATVLMHGSSGAESDTNFPKQKGKKTSASSSSRATFASSSTSSSEKENNKKIVLARPVALRLWMFLFPSVSYGYAIMLAGGILWLAIAPGASFSVGFFVQKFLDDKVDPAATRSLVSIYWSIGMVGAAILQTLWGRLIDKIGGRKTLIVAIPAFIILLAIMPFITSVHLLLPLFLFLRLAQCPFTAVLFWCINNWFRKYRGKATAIANLFGAITFAGPSALEFLAIHMHWKTVMYMEVVYALLFSLFGFFLTLDRPEDYGLLPDGAEKKKEKKKKTGNSLNKKKSILWFLGGSRTPPSSSSSSTKSSPRDEEAENSLDNLAEKQVEEQEEGEGEENNEASTHDDPNYEADHPDGGWPWQEAIRTRLFLTMCSSVIAIGFFYSGFNLHYTDILKEQELDSMVGLTFLVLSTSCFVVTGAGGPLIDFLKQKQRGIALGCACGCISAFCLLFAKSTWMLVIFGILLGATDALLFLGQSIVFATAFGRKNLGTISAFCNACYQLALGLGPSMMGISRDYLGSFHLPILVIGILLGVHTILLYIPAHPKRREQKVTSGDTEMKQIETDSAV